MKLRWRRPLKTTISSSEAEFEGFEQQEIDAVNILGSDLSVFEIPDLDNDQDFPCDVNLGWKRQNLDPL